MASKSASKQNAATSRRPTWKEQALARRTELAAHFKDDLQAISAIFAQHESSEAVLVRHVDHAFSSLSRLGLLRRRFFLRADFWSSIGGLPVGIAPAIPDWIGTLPDRAKAILWANNLPQIIAASVFAAGAVILCSAWFKGVKSCAAVERGDKCPEARWTPRWPVRRGHPAGDSFKRAPAGAPEIAMSPACPHVATSRSFLSIGTRSGMSQKLCGHWVPGRERAIRYDSSGRRRAGAAFSWAGRRDEKVAR